MTNPDEVKDKFYDDLDSIISATHLTDKLILLGDFNARVGTEHKTWEGVTGSEDVGKCNSNGLLLLRKFAEHDLLVTHTVPKQDILDASPIQTLASHRLCHIDRMIQKQRLCMVQTDRQITDWLSVNLI